MSFELKLSCVTTCMNRCKSIQRTLLNNIKLSGNVPVEYVLLNYGSKDDLNSYVKNNLSEYMNNGKLCYYEFLEPPDYFHMSRAKNIAHLLGTGNVLFNSDAEWAMNINFFDLVTNTFKTGTEKKFLHLGGKGGGIAVYTHDFKMVGGYDESMCGWGYDDSDFFNRLRVGFSYEQIRTNGDYGVNLGTRNLHGRRDNSNVPSTHIKNNLHIHRANMASKKYVVNQNLIRGNIKLRKNFTEIVSV